MAALTGQTALVTGSTQGVGQAMAEAIAEAGGRVVLHGLESDEAALEALQCVREHDHDAQLVTVDLAGPMPDCVDDLFDDALELRPDIDLLVSNVGTFIDQPFLKMEFEIIERTMRLNVLSHLRLIQRFAQHWTKNGIAGRIVVTGSINGLLAEPNHVAYDTSKGAIHSMVRSLCVALAPHSIRVNGIAPGLFETPLTAPALKDPGVRRWMEHHTPNHIVPDADVCKSAVVFLLSEGAAHIHGQMLYIDGGMSVWQQPDPLPH